MKDWDDPKNDGESAVFDALQHASRCIERAIGDANTTQSMMCGLEGVWLMTMMAMRETAAPEK